MGKMISKTKMVAAVFISFVAFLLLTPKAEALEPRLLWEKNLKFEITNMNFAKNTGDIIVSGGFARQMILFDKDGNERFHWGPRLDRQPHRVNITPDGMYFYYTSSLTDEFIEKYKKTSNEVRLHYVRKNGKELWSKPLPLDQGEGENVASFHISPDGKYVAFVGVPGEGCCIDLWDIAASRRVWRLVSRGGFESFVFSPDSKYMAAASGGVLELMDMAKNSLFVEDAGFIITSIAVNANYVATTFATDDVGIRLFDKQGNIILQGGPDDYTFVSESGNKAVLWDRDGLKIYSLPDKSLLGTYLIKRGDPQVYFNPLYMSGDGRIVAASGSKIGSQSDNNLFIIDTVEKKMWEGKIPAPQFQELYLTNDGKYMLVSGGGRVPGAKSKLLYYQLY